MAAQGCITRTTGTGELIMTNFEIKETENSVEIMPLDSNPEKSRPSQRRWLMPLIFSVVVLAVLFFGIRSRLNAEASLRSVTAQMAVPSVSVVHPKPAAPAQEVILPGNMQPFISSPVYARTDGYVKKWYFDIGAHVKAGQLLATIQTPEIDEQLSQAQSTLATAQANLNLAEITKTRYEAMFQKHAVAQQDRDNAAGTYSANKAIVDADMANVRHYEALVSFEKVYAPFDGVITARNTDIGDLINAGSSSTAKTDLFHIAQTDTVRVYVNVPEEYSRGVQPGVTEADILVAEFPGQKFPGKVVRTAEAINGNTRTLLGEIDLPNPGETLLTGSYVEVHLNIPSANSTFLIPVSTLIFRSERLQAGVVRNGKVELADVTPGHDFGSEIEVVAGLKPDDQVVMNPPDSLVAGQQVNIVQASLPGDGK
jgi:RND family efflux transporter MFP subunit